ncbi:MAG: Asp-tRNA(Asn)/Glu-tRNA(Gln) amidotransferase subunit GatA [Gammaproteobacteria bacterium]|nr:Asp-tRNA(Asn)/Glu-tRNA(Gln) amidotransferase subunit GatA [Gammaproteobacteria bacterium]
MDPYQSLKQLRQLLDSKQISVTELCQYFLDRIAQFDQRTNSFVSVEPEQVLAEARSTDKTIDQGVNGQLTGIPVAHKDNFCVRGKRTSCCSNLLRTFIAPYDATIVKNIAKAGGIYFGKTNMDEFAMGTSNQTSVWGPVRNPWDLSRVPGGSSGGSAAAVAAGLVPVATGSDTGGSIRQPASFCGVTGFKPTYGRLSRYGMIAFASSLDQAGTLTRTAQDATTMFQILQSHDSQDATSVPSSINKKVQIKHPLTIGYSASLLNGLDSDIVARIEASRNTLEQLGSKFVDVEVFDQDLALSSYYIISCAEASSNLARFDGVRYGSRAKSVSSIQDLYEDTRSHGFGAEVKRRLLAGTYFLSNNSSENYVQKAQKIRRMVYELYNELFQKVDVVLAPSSPSTAFRLDEEHDSTDMYRQDRFTVPVNLCGLPAISVPCGLVNGLPIGVQFIGPQFGDELILDLAERFQKETSWHLQRPKI